MPNRPMRLNPGQNTNSGGGKLDLGSILLGIFGGVEANPDFNQEQARTDPNMSGPMPAKPGADNFYKPRSIFNNADAAELNAGFKQQQLLNNQEEARTNRLADATIPRQVNLRTSIDPLDLAKHQAENDQDLNKYRQEKTIDVNSLVDQRTRIDPIDIAKEMQQGNISVNNQNSLADTALLRKIRERTLIDPFDINKRQVENAQDINKQAQLGTQANFSRAGLLNLADLPQAAERTQQNNLDDIAAQQNAARINAATGVNNANLGYNTQQQTAPFSLRHAIAGAQGGALESEGNVANLPAKLLSEREGFRNKPLFDAMRAQAESVKIGREGDTFYDTAIGRPTYQVPYTPIQQLINQSVGAKLNTSPQRQNPQPNPPANSPIAPLNRPNGFHISDFITDSQGNILGLKPRR